MSTATQNGKPSADLHTDPHWVGRLSFAIAHNLPRIESEPRRAEHDLSETLREFLRTPLARGDLGVTLRKEMGK